MTDLPKIYAANEFEDAIYQQWEASGFFTPKIDPKKKPFVVTLPPPNATGELHLGHATMLAIEDIMVRFHRMKGTPTLWLPGTDHAAIATQNKVEKVIAQEGLTRQDLGRKRFLKRVQEFVVDSQDTIRNQMRKMGASVDWTRERYTMDESSSHAVRTAFVRLFDDGLIYRGHRIVNWCVRCQSTLADDEVEYREEKAPFYYFKYGPFVIGTARPETKFLDKVIVVHPKDKRYKKWIGKTLTVEWLEGPVAARLMADESVDPEFGTGAMTITPAHDLKDFDIAQRHPEIEIVQIIDEKGHLTRHAGEFAGMNARDARSKIVEKLQGKGLVERIDEEYVHNVSVCYRCDTPIEPLISEQWFINVNKKVKGKSLKDRALEVVKKGKIEILPERFAKIYFHWMENLRDWCISRQIWWGHQIPVWYCDNKSGRNKCDEPIVSLKDPTHCPHCKGAKLHQDPDTLDTWFSSGLWTFSTLGWPKKTKDLAYFHPTSVLETGHDILFFWVARMILLTTYLMEEIPFETVYLHGLVRDKEGRKMSKSLNNGIDPLDMIRLYGTDAVRLSLVLGASPGNDVRLYEEKIASYRNFVNKIWNGARYVLMNVEPSDFGVAIDLKPLTAIDQWILCRTQEVIQQATEAIEHYRFSEAGTLIYDFFWSEYCDWYLEMSKVQQNKAVLAYVLKAVLTLLHPFTPFVTEVLWKEMRSKGLLIQGPWPEVESIYKFSKAKSDISLLIQLVTAVRQVRAEYRLEPGKIIPCVLYGGSKTKMFQDHREVIERLARIRLESISKEGEKTEGALAQFVGPASLYLSVADLINLDQERERLQKEIEDIQNYVKGLEGKLNNKGYLANAPKAIVEADRGRLQDAKERLERFKQQLGAL